MARGRRIFSASTTAGSSIVSWLEPPLRHDIARECMRAWCRAVLALAPGIIACTPPGERAALECIAPAAAGGGWDLTCRATARILREQGLIPRVMRVTNLPGAGGGIAFANVVGRRHGDPDVIIAASPATTLRLAQGQYGDLEAAQVRWVAALGADFGIVGVRADAPWQSLDELLDAWRADPSRIVVGGGSAVGGQDHIKMLVLGRTAGIDPRRIRYVPFDGGGEAMTSMLGGFIQVFSGDGSEVLGQLEAGNIRVLAALAPARLEGPLARVPTAREQGYDIDWITWRGFYLPDGVPDDVYTGWADALRTIEASPEWADVRRRNGLGPFLLAGDEFERFVHDQVRTFKELSFELGLAR
jgi:putative tricarboxylic transport membrane protein